VIRAVLADMGTFMAERMTTAARLRDALPTYIEGQRGVHRGPPRSDESPDRHLHERRLQHRRGRAGSGVPAGADPVVRAGGRGVPRSRPGRDGDPGGAGQKATVGTLQALQDWLLR
jgi:hypothetical protein